MDNNQMFDTNNSQPEVYAPMDAQPTQPVEAAPQYNAQPQYQQPQYQQPQYTQPQYAAPQYAAPQPAKKKLIGLSIASLVLGILSLLACCCYCGALFGIPGAICGAIAMAKKADGKGMAIAGLICSILGVLLCIITWFLIGIGAVEMSNMGYDYYYYY